VRNLETAKALKNAGLKWEPKRGDFYINHPEYPKCEAICIGVQERVNIVKQWANDDHIIWLPNLSQLLAELRKHSRFVKITWLVMDEKWCCVIDAREQFLADTPEEAAAKALLWVLERNGGE
jgi:hypothetical protein